MHDMIDSVVKEAKKKTEDWKIVANPNDKAFKHTLDGIRINIEENKKALSSALEETDDGKAIDRCERILKSKLSVEEVSPSPQNPFVFDAFLDGFNKLHKKKQGSTLQT